MGLILPTRRSFFKGAAAAAAAPLLPREALARRPRARNLYEPPKGYILRGCMSRGNLLGTWGSAIINPQQNTQQDRQYQTAPAGSAITNIVFGVSGIIIKQVAPGAEQADLYARTHIMAIETGGSSFPVTWNGGRQVTVTPGEPLKYSDPCPIVIPAGQVWYPRGWMKLNFGVPTATVDISAGGNPTNFQVTGGGFNLNLAGVTAMSVSSITGAGAGSGFTASLTVTNGILVSGTATGGSGFTQGTGYAVVFTNGVSWLNSYLPQTNASGGAADGGHRGTDLADITLSTGTITRDGSSAFGPEIFAEYITPGLVFGNISSSTDAGSADKVETTTGRAGFYERQFGRTGIISVGVPSATIAGFFTTPLYRESLIRSRCTDVFLEIGGNDILSNGVAAATVWAQTQALIAWCVANGIKVHLLNVQPRTNSTDSWTTTGNQTIASAANNAIAVTYNSLASAGWAAAGASSYHDYRAAIESSAGSGLWKPADNSGQAGTDAAFHCTITAGAISGGTLVLEAGGSGYPNGTNVVNCSLIYPPGCPGTGAVLGNVTSSGGAISAVVVTSGGSGHSAAFPPVVDFSGQYTAEGTHPNRHGHNYLMVNGGPNGTGLIDPTLFTY